MSGPRTEDGRRVLPWHAASHFNRGGMLPAEAHDAALADILAIEAEARTKALDEVRAAVKNINDRDLDTLTIALVLAEIDKLKEVPTDER